MLLEMNEMLYYYEHNWSGPKTCLTQPYPGREKTALVKFNFNGSPIPRFIEIPPSLFPGC